MPRIGDNTSPDLSQDRIGNVRQQVATLLTMPQDGTITKLGTFIRGLSGHPSIHYYLCVWSHASGNALLGRTARLVSNTASFSLGSLTKVTALLVEPVALSDGDSFYVGISADTASGSAHQWGIRTSGTKYYRDLAGGAAWPASMNGYHTQPNRLAAWVESFTTVSAGPVVYVRRGGTWVRAESIQVRRAGAWADAASVQVRRSSAWVDSDA